MSPSVCVCLSLHVSVCLYVCLSVCFESLNGCVSLSVSVSDYQGVCVCQCACVSTGLCRRMVVSEVLTEMCWPRQRAGHLLPEA